MANVGSSVLPQRHIAEMQIKHLLFTLEHNLFYLLNYGQNRTNNSVANNIFFSWHSFNTDFAKTQRLTFRHVRSINFKNCDSLVLFGTCSITCFIVKVIIWNVTSFDGLDCPRNPSLFVFIALALLYTKVHLKTFGTGRKRK